MQPAPFRLSQALWTAFQAAKPTHQQSFLQLTRRTHTNALAQRWSGNVTTIRKINFVRFYSDRAQHDDVEKRVKDAKERIDQSLESRASVAQDAGPSLKSEKEETIVHTLPESSSIVYKKDAPSGASAESHSSSHGSNSHTRNSTIENDGKRYAAWASSQWQNSPLPSQIASLRSRASKRFTSFMDNLQSQIVVASHHINDLTGYTGIERLKREIEAQEAAVQNARQHVKDSRDKYSEAIAMRSTTQREVNDLLHRKHAWSPTDLERFTSLYRSDHANEQAEQKSHQQLSEAEAQYEESSTRLAKSILARYHEEQIWSDKIRQMSTWGTWGLMGLNVLLFIVFQIAIEPWRRRRLVRGFEEKVQAALDEKERVTDEKLALIQSQRNGDQIVQDAVQQQSEGLVATAAEQVAEAIADAVSGSTDSSQQTQRESGYPKSEEIEAAAELITERELQDEGEAASTPAIAEAIAATTKTTPFSTIPPHATQVSVSTASNNEPQTWRTHTTTWGSYTVASVAQHFNDKEHVVLSKRELTAKVLEGVAAGIAVACGIMFVVVRQQR